MKRIVTIGSIILVVAAVAYYLLGNRGSQGPGHGFEETRVKRGQVQETITATGEVRAGTGAQITLGARVTGTVVKEPIVVGDKVKKGDLIAIIDNRELKEELTKAEAALKQVKIKFEDSIREQQLQIRELEYQVQEKASVLRAAKAELAFRQWNFDTVKALYGGSGKNLSEKTFREAKNQLVQAQEGLKQAQNGLSAAKAALERARITLERLKKEYKQELVIAETDLSRARIRYSYSVLRAPFSGVITYVSTQEGETVVAGMNAPEFVKILDESKMENWIYIDETDIGKVKSGMEVTFTVDAYVGHTYKGHINQIYPAPVIQNNIVYYIAVVRIENPRPKLNLKMTTHNKIYIRRLRNVLVVPNSAVRFKDGSYVVRVRDKSGKIRFQKVEIGPSDERYIQIKSGLKEGDIVLYTP